jgi:hypothetical protein
MSFCNDSCDSYSQQCSFEGRKQVEMFLNIYKLSRYYETFIDEGFDRILCVSYGWLLRKIYTNIITVIGYNRIWFNIIKC